MSGLGARSFRCDGTPIEPYGGGDEIDMFDEEGFDSERRRKHHPHKPGRRLERHHPRRKTAHDANMVVPDVNHWVRCIRGACLRGCLGLEARTLLDVRGGVDGVHHSIRTGKWTILTGTQATSLTPTQYIAARPAIVSGPSPL